MKIIAFRCDDSFLRQELLCILSWSWTHDQSTCSWVPGFKHILPLHCGTVHLGRLMFIFYFFRSCKYNVGDLAWKQFYREFLCLSKISSHCRFTRSPVFNIFDTRYALFLCRVPPASFPYPSCWIFGGLHLLSKWKTLPLCSCGFCWSAGPQKRLHCLCAFIIAFLPLLKVLVYFYDLKGFVYVTLSRKENV